MRYGKIRGKAEGSWKMSGESISITSKTPFTGVYIDGYVYVYLDLI